MKLTERQIRAALPVTAVLLVAAVALVLMATAHWRRGSVMFAAAAVLAAGLRAVLSDAAAGPLAVRGKRFDVVFCLTAAAVFGVLAVGLTAE